MNVISVALWGDDDKYIAGAIENARLAKEIYPGWAIKIITPRAWCDNHAGAAKKIEANGASLYQNHDYGDGSMFGLFDRFMLIGFAGYNHVIIRDADSRLNWREKAAVDEWIASGKTYHIMRDHPSHRRPMLGGLWGAKGGAIPGIAEKIKAWLGDRSVKHDMDQHFLADVVWPKARKDCVVHDSQFRHEDETPSWGGQNWTASSHLTSDAANLWAMIPTKNLNESIAMRPNKFPPHADIAPSRFVGDVILVDGTPDPSIKDPGVLG